jgi:hypothetical protein
VETSAEPTRRRTRLDGPNAIAGVAPERVAGQRSTVVARPALDGEPVEELVGCSSGTEHVTVA